MGRFFFLWVGEIFDTIFTTLFSASCCARCILKRVGLRKSERPLLWSEQRPTYTCTVASLTLTMYIAQVSSCGLSVLNSYIGFTSCVCEYRETPPETDIRLYEDSTVAVDLKVNQYVLPPPFDVVR